MWVGGKETLKIDSVQIGPGYGLYAPGMLQARYLNQYWLVINKTKNIFQWKFTWNSKVSLNKNSFQ